jgi:hypothetical protein
VPRDGAILEDPLAGADVDAGADVAQQAAVAAGKGGQHQPPAQGGDKTIPKRRSQPAPHNKMDRPGERKALEGLGRKPLAPRGGT